MMDTLPDMLDVRVVSYVHDCIGSLRVAGGYDYVVRLHPKVVERVRALSRGTTCKF